MVFCDLTAFFMPVHRRRCRRSAKIVHVSRLFQCGRERKKREKENLPLHQTCSAGAWMGVCVRACVCLYMSESVSMGCVWLPTTARDGEVGRECYLESLQQNKCTGIIDVWYSLSLSLLSLPFSTSLSLSRSLSLLQSALQHFLLVENLEIVFLCNTTVGHFLCLPMNERLSLSSPPLLLLSEFFLGEKESSVSNLSTEC